MLESWQKLRQIMKTQNGNTVLGHIPFNIVNQKSNHPPWSSFHSNKPHNSFYYIILSIFPNHFAQIAVNKSSIFVNDRKLLRETILLYVLKDLQFCLILFLVEFVGTIFCAFWKGGNDFM